MWARNLGLTVVSAPLVPPGVQLCVTLCHFVGKRRKESCQLAVGFLNSGTLICVSANALRNQQTGPVSRRDPLVNEMQTFKIPQSTAPPQQALSDGRLPRR